MLEEKVTRTNLRKIRKDEVGRAQTRNDIESKTSSHFNEEDFLKLRISIDESLETLESHLNKAANYHFQKPGKQIRGLLGLSSGKHLSVDDHVILDWATAVELLHNASLIHDDIRDKDRNRRGRPSIFAKYGEHTALCLGDAIVSLSFHLCCQNDKPKEMIKLFSDRMLGAVSGQACERINIYPNWDNYLKITRGKTSSLLSLPIEGALILAEKTNKCDQVKAYFDYAGPIFQITNDIRNFDGSDGANHIFSDLWDCRPNAIISLFRSYLKNGSIEIFDSWVSDRRTNQNQTNQTELFNYWRKKIADSPARENLLKKLNQLYSMSQSNLDEFPKDLAPIIKSFNSWLTAEVTSIKNTPYFNININ